MKNLIFIKTQTYNDTLVGPQLNRLLDYSVYLDGECCCKTNPKLNNDIAYSLTMDNIVYLTSNYILSKLFDSIIISYHFTDNQTIENIINHLNCDDYQISIFELTNTGVINDVEDFELKYKEYHSEYFTIEHNRMVKYSKIDVTAISAFKAAKVLENIIKC